ncbi:hypothetical protein [Thiomicrospira sp. ALE5]|uniref:hypothetical protein n=1 Tax=Thiomicrospira sp. ALE5 TaxID=748650 RepID=UPI00135657FE|nr:hypothetical protein [Thiomicrospira sp. ALE5]
MDDLFLSIQPGLVLSLLPHGLFNSVDKIMDIGGVLGIVCRIYPLIIYIVFLSL